MFEIIQKEDFKVSSAGFYFFFVVSEGLRSHLSLLLKVAGFSILQT